MTDKKAAPPGLLQNAWPWILCLMGVDRPWMNQRAKILTVFIGFSVTLGYATVTAAVPATSSRDPAAG